MTYIIDKLYIGNIDEAYDTDHLREKLNISHILTVNDKPIGLKSREGFEYKHVHALDMVDQDLLSHFEESNSFIEEGRASGAVFVHCFAGQSRSATLILAYLMHKMDLTLEDALKLARAQSPGLRPNAGFLKQLELYESMGCSADHSNKIFKAYRLEKLANYIQKADAFTALPDNMLIADPSTSHGGSEITYKCRKCRRPLFRQSCLLDHEQGHGELTFRQPWLASPSDTGHEVCQQSLFVEPVEWMKSQILKSDGKLSCPKCAAKLGSFNWSGERCPCGTWVTPAFHISSSKVDECKPRVLPLYVQAQPLSPRSNNKSELLTAITDCTNMPDTSVNELPKGIESLPLNDT